MRSSLTGGLRLPVAAFRAVLLLLCVLLAVLPAGVNTEALWLVGVLAVVAVLATWLGARDAVAVPAGLVEALVAGVLVSASGGSASPLLPYLLATGLALGLAGGWRAALLGAAVALAGMVGWRVLGDPADPVQEFVAIAAQWVLLSAAVGVMAAWARTISRPDVAEVDRYAEARGLLEQLRSVTRRLPGGLDAPSAADAILEACAAVAPFSRAAVLAETPGGDLVPLAVRGTRRVPWRAPLGGSGPLSRAWESRRPVVDRREPDTHGRRQGSTLAVVPLLSDDAPFGLVILEVLQPDAYPPATVELLAEAVQDGALRLETALLFDEVRSAATVEERDRLAREMHDGMAQDIAFLGYELDALRVQAAKVDPELAASVAELRGRLTALISDIRLSITDLRTSVSSDRGLGSALSSYVRAVGSGKDLTVHLSLQESAFRLPGEQEVLLFQVAQAVAQDIRKGRKAGHLWVTLAVDPPSAYLEVEHDGPMQDLEALGLEEFATSLSKVGGQLDVLPGQAGGPRVVVTLKGEADAGLRSAGR